MGATWKGKARGPVRRRANFTFDPDQQQRYEAEYVGSPTGIESMIQETRRWYPEASIRTSRDGPLSVMTYTLNATGELEGREADVVWSVRTEMLEKSIFEHPKVAAEAATVDPPGKYKKDIEDSVSLGAVLDLYLEQKTYAPMVYIALCQGITGYQDEVTVLRRTRSAPLEYPFGRDIYESKVIYTTAQLGLPPDFDFIFSDTEIDARPVPAGFKYGWRLRTQDFAIAGNKMEEVIEWCLAAWSLMLYYVSPSAYPQKV